MDETFFLTFGIIIILLMILCTFQTDMFVNADDPQTDWDKQIGKINEVAKAACPPGYSGGKTATCQTDKNWKVTDTCVPVVCKADGTWSDATATFGNSVTRGCPYGKQGMDVAICQADGKFSAAEGCTDITCNLGVQKPLLCRVPDNDTTGWTARTAIPGNKIYANCPPGMFGSREITCGPTGGNDWINDINKCKFGPTLKQGERLGTDRQMFSTSGKNYVSIGFWGNLQVFNRDDRRVYDVGGDSTANDSKWYLIVQSDGNMIVQRDRAGGGVDVRWKTDTNGKGVGPFRLTMQNDGNLVLYDGNNNPTWASNTSWEWSSIRWKGDAGRPWCFDIQGRSSAPGSRLEMWKCDSNNAYTDWKFDNKQRLVNKASGKCLDVPAYGRLQEAYLWDCHDGDNQKWIVNNNGLFQNKGSVAAVTDIGGVGMCLDMGKDGNKNDGQRPVLWPCGHSGINQQFDM